MAPDGSDGGGGGSTASKEPWHEAAPWLKSNLWAGQDLQKRYMDNPFSELQKRAYGNQFANSNYMRTLTGDVVNQLGGQRTFDRGRPSAVPQRLQLPMMSGATENMGLGSGMYGNINDIFKPATATAPVAPAPAQNGSGNYTPGTEDMYELLRRIREHEVRFGTARSAEGDE